MSHWAGQGAWLEFRGLPAGEFRAAGFRRFAAGGDVSVRLGCKRNNAPRFASLTGVLSRQDLLTLLHATAVPPQSE